MSNAPIVLSRGEGSIVHTDDGRRLVDLAMGFGAAFLGHSNPAVVARVAAQVDRLWSAGREPTVALARVQRLVNTWLPSGLELKALCSTGMEAAELALRIAAVHAGRTEFAGFARSMHGKSAMTAALCWSNPPLRPGGLHTLPFVDDCPEEEILRRLEALLATRRIAAVLVEPIQGSNGAHAPSTAFLARVVALCREHGSLSIFDEILTGLHRTGPRFVAETLEALPDMLLFAKAMGNGFPVSAVAAAPGIRVGPEALPGSTFSGNPLALAAVEGTLEAMSALDLAARVATIEETVRASLAPAQSRGVTLRGRGALWCLEPGGGVTVDAAVARIRAAGVLVSAAGRFIRLLPAATIDPGMLRDSCAIVGDACAGATRRPAVENA